MSQSGRILTHPSLARRRFVELAHLPEEELDLMEASLVIALEEYPALAVGDYLQRIESWSEAIRERVEGSRDIERIIEEVNRLLFEEEGFHGEASDYYDPRVAFLNQVLDFHAGLPISLSIVWIEISRRLGVETHGVSLPGRFLVKVSGDWGEILLDPFDDGRVLTTVECQEIIDQVFGGAIRLREQHLRSFGRHEVLSRFLSHLKGVYLAQNDLEGALATIDRLLILDARDAYEVRDRGLLALQMHRYAEASAYLERYMELMPHAEDRARIGEQIAWLRAWLEHN